MTDKPLEEIYTPEQIARYHRMIEDGRRRRERSFQRWLERKREKERQNERVKMNIDETNYSKFRSLGKLGDSDAVILKKIINHFSKCNCFWNYH